MLRRVRRAAQAADFLGGLDGSPPDRGNLANVGLMIFWLFALGMTAVAVIEGEVWIGALERLDGSEERAPVVHEAVFPLIRTRGSLAARDEASFVYGHSVVLLEAWRGANQTSPSFLDVSRWSERLVVEQNARASLGREVAQVLRITPSVTGSLEPLHHWLGLSMPTVDFLPPLPTLCVDFLNGTGAWPELRNGLAV
jgi:hypothetical protein